MSGVKLTDIVEKMNLKNLTPEVDITEREVLVPDVNRPALQLAGFFDHFDLNRVQIIGNVECAYLETLEEEKRVEIYQKLCVILSEWRSLGKRRTKILTWHLFLDLNKALYLTHRKIK